MRSPAVLDLVPERLELARRYDIEVVDVGDGSGSDRVRELTDGRGADSVIEAVGMEAHGAPLANVAQRAAGLLPDALARPVFAHAGIDRMSALLDAFDAVRRGGTISIVGVYGGQLDPFPMMDIFDKGLSLRMG